MRVSAAILIRFVRMSIAICSISVRSLTSTKTPRVNSPRKPSRNPGILNICIRPKFRATISPIRTMPKTRVNQGANGQYKTTVPKGIAEAMEMDGKRLVWKIKSGNALEVSVVDD